ncbi:hypothetical protein KL937_000597 [Ogataea polymorpha]|uniref:C3HC-type domain-containing protein n=1 Tax=Ogataea polymorpha TaxID=460523 RepID=A0A9P8P008_9ASCO|nr:hypothetical protein KL937_000597 [Ogataea polymorpha]KAG7939656.1 hypothetical protein KL904_000594 [Ogataea polymorpha]KAH3662702.1 hypothetical protein OGATHE_004278 [Ogataea polymorpha]
MDDTATTSAILDILSSICLSSGHSNVKKHVSPSSLRSHLPHVLPQSTPKSVNKRKLSNSSDPLILNKSPKVNRSGGTDPFNKNTLDERINSFNILNWSFEDDKLNPLECAVNGWQCHKRKNELHCHYCNAVLLIRLNEQNDKNKIVTNFLFVEDEEAEEQFFKVREQLISSYLRRLRTDHYPGCMWRNSNLDIELVRKQYHLKISDMNEILEQYQGNLENLIDHQDIIMLKSYTIDIVNKSQIEILQAYNSTNLILSMVALFGWELKQQKFGSKNLALLKCHKCTRRILLGESENLDHTEPLKSVSYPAEISNEDSDINLLAEHEHWCCMVTEFNNLKGYEVVLRILQSVSLSDGYESMEVEQDHSYTFDSTMALLREFS